MEFHVRAHSVTVSDETRAYAEQKISAPLSKVLGSDASRIDVEITDLARGTGKPCFRVSVHGFIPHAKTQVVHVEDEDMRAAIDVAADKILRAVKRGRNKRRDRARHSGEWEAPVLDLGDDDADGTEMAAS
jgi:ribosomal subunit interface protein